jgi:hypothetical protein
MVEAYKYTDMRVSVSGEHRMIESQCFVLDSQRSTLALLCFKPLLHRERASLQHGTFESSLRHSAHSRLGHPYNISPGVIRSHSVRPAVNRGLALYDEAANGNQLRRVDFRGRIWSCNHARVDSEKCLDK